MPTPYARRMFSDTVSYTDQLSGGITNSALSFTLKDGSTFPNGSSGNFTVTINPNTATEEKVECSSRTGGTFTVASGGRGLGGTTAVAHNANEPVVHTICSKDLDEANNAVSQTLGAIAAQGDLLVGTGANALAKLTKGAANTFLTSNGTTLAYVAFGSGGTTAIAASGSDGVSNNPARYDHTHAGVTSFNGSGGAVTGLVSISNGYGITGATGTTPAPAVALTTSTGALGIGGYAITTSMATFLTSASLGTGTWLITLSGQVACQNNIVEIQAVNGTAVVSSLTGTLSTELTANAAAIEETNFSITFLAVVTSAGTFIFQAKAANTTGSPSINGQTPQSGLNNSTTYVAVRIA